MKKILFSTLYLVTLLFFAACEPNTPDKETPQEETIPTSFPKKHLIEEFTGQGCGYCPYGMDCIHEFVGNDTNYVLVLHHYGYSPDHFSVKGSNTITSALKVSGAPNVTVNRAATQYKDENGRSQSAVVFHPAYFLTTQASQFEKETYASILINNEYDPATRELTVRLSGRILKEDHPELKLTVLVKESGMIDTQADYYKTFEGWKEFRHTNAVRAFLSAAKGDDMLIIDGKYSDIFTLTLDEKWVPENCMVVAFISEAFQPIVQAEQKPVVSGTQGGADILHGGITPVSVPDYYPEPDAVSGPGDLSGNKHETLTTTQAYSKAEGDLRLWTLMTYDATANITVSGAACVPFAYIYLVTSASETTIPAGTYPINVSGEAGTVFAGYRDNEQQLIDGSIFYFTDKEYFNEGYLNPAAQWLITSGSMTVTEQGWSLSGQARNGASIHLEGTTPITYPKSNAPAKLKRK